MVWDQAGLIHCLIGGGAYLLLANDGNRKATQLCSTTSAASWGLRQVWGGEGEGEGHRYAMYRVCSICNIIQMPLNYRSNVKCRHTHTHTLTHSDTHTHTHPYRFRRIVSGVEQCELYIYYAAIKWARPMRRIRNALIYTKSMRIFVWTVECGQSSVRNVTLLNVTCCYVAIACL